MANTDSSSGEITASFVNISDVFTQYTEIPTTGFNTLYKAQRFGKWFIIKGLKEEHKSNPIYRELLAKEFILGIQLSHENIVRFYSKEIDPVVGECIVMEYVDGLTLSAFLKTNPRRQVREKIALQLLQAMAYYQSLQIIHRDLKPENILITRNGNNVKIIDFGLSDTDTSAVLKQPAGSPKYMAPEQRDNNMAIDARADLYAFAKILQTIFPSLPPLWRKVVHHCGQEDRKKRPTNAEEVLQLLQHFKKRRSIMMSILSLMVTLLLLVIASYIIMNHYVIKDKWVEEADRGIVSGPSVIGDTLAPVQEITVIHDTVIQYKEKAELTPEMINFLKLQSKIYWSTFDKEYQKYEERINRLLNGESGDIQEDTKIYNELWALYSNLSENNPTELEKHIIPKLKKKYPNAKYVDTFEITTSYYKYSNQNVRLAQMLMDIYSAIQQYDK